MSCTVLALPILLAKVIAAVAAVEIDNVIENNEEWKAVSYGSSTCDNVDVISARHFIEKSFETAFMDKDLLIKTLDEHGVANIKEGEVWEKGKITGQVDNYTLTFERESENQPYYLKITCLDSDNPEEKLNDLSSEYALNTQEETYLNILDKLKDNNMELESEEVLDDNTIVLTVNLE